MDASLRQNLEVKVRHADLDAAREALGRLGAQFGAIEVQRDTYFRVPRGRLKLREIDGRVANLIWYERPDREGVRGSAYYLVPVADAPAMRAALTAALGITGEVRKQREIHFWHNVRIHLDQVNGLGSFLEMEAVLASEPDEIASRERLHHLSAALGISAASQIASSYIDLQGIDQPG